MYRDFKENSEEKFRIFLQFFCRVKDISYSAVNQTVKVQNGKNMTKDYIQEKIDQYEAMLYRIAYLQLKNRYDAQDVVQEVFYQYIKYNKEFESDEHEKAWLIRVTLNGCRKLWRSAWFRRTEGMPKQQDMPAESLLEQEVVEREQKRELLEEVWKLPAKYREVIHLFYFEQLSVKEISSVTGRKESTVTSQLTRGRDILKKKLKEEYRYE